MSHFITDDNRISTLSLFHIQLQQVIASLLIDTES